jgi:hypothetical protein
MIVSKPKPQALFAIGMFVLVCFSLGGYNLSFIIKGSTWFFNYVMAIVFLPLGFILLIRQMINYKIISVGNDKIQVWYPLRFNTLRAPLNKVEYWQETIIQTKTGVFRQLEVVFPSKTIKMSVQENSNYKEVVNYFKKKLARKVKK